MELAYSCLNIKEISMKRSIALVSLAATLAVATLAHGAAAFKADNCSDCPIDNCPFCPHAK